MLEDLNKGQKIFMIIVFLLTIISVVFGGYAIYNILEHEKPWTLGVTYADVLETEEKETPIISINIHSNENENGESVYDFRINSYTDHEGNGVAGFGIQCVGDWKIINNSKYEEYSYATSYIKADSFISSNKAKYGGAFNVESTIAFGKFSFYYTGDNGEIYTTTYLDNIPNYMLINIGEEFYRMKLKSYQCEVLNDDFWAWLPFVSDYKTVDTAFTWFEVFDRVMRFAIDSNAKTKYEEFSLSLFDLSDFIVVEGLNDKGQYVSVETTSETRNYFTIFVDYSKDGLTNASESIFGMVNNSTTWSVYEDLDVEEYWKAYADIIINVSNLNYVYDESNESYYATLDENLSSYFNTLSDSEISCDFDFTSFDIDVGAINLKNFNFKIKSFNIKTNDSNFKIYNQDYCLVVPELEVV